MSNNQLNKIRKVVGILPFRLFSSFLLLTSIALLLLSCGTRSGHFKIEGRFLHINQGELYVYSPDGGLTGMDTIKIQAGRFAYETRMKEPATLILVFPNFSEHAVFAESGASVDIKADASHLKEMTVTGTKDNKLMNRFRRQIVDAAPPQEKKIAAEFIEEHPESRVSVYLLQKYFLKTEKPDFIGAQRLLRLMTPLQKENTLLLALSHQVTALATSQKGAHLPHFTATDINNKPVSDAMLRKGIAVISVWASWNYESLEMQRILADNKEKGGDKLHLLSISVDASRRECSERLEANRITWSVVCDQLMMEGRLMQQLGLYMPADNIIVLDGRVVERSLSNSELREQLTKLLN